MKKYIQILLTPLLFFLFSCEEIEIASNILEIEYKEFRISDTTLVFSFRDGDGDIGLAQGDTTVDYNFFLTYFKWDTGDEMFDSIEMPSPPNFRIPYVPEPEGVNKSLIGEIEIDLAYAWPNQDKLAETDSFYMRFYMKDRALHKSNVDSMFPSTIKTLWEKEWQ